jgi:diguanylate cyclase (GGDEF)-like protein
MPRILPELSISEPDPALLDNLAWLKRAMLAVAALIAVVTLGAWFIPRIDGFFPDGWRLMKANSAFAVLLAAISLRLSEPRYSRRMHLLSQLLATLVALVGVSTVIEYSAHISMGIDTLLAMDRASASEFPGRMAPQTAGAIAFLGIALLPIGAQRRISTLMADFLVACVCVRVLVLVSGHIFGAMRIFGISSTVQTSPQTLVCLALLTTAAVLRRAENGIFSIFLGHGIGSKIARTLAPILLVLSFLREAGRAHLVQTLQIPENYATAILASIATAVSFVLLLFLTWRIHGMELEIRNLSLRDELTGLHNLRGFHVLAEQALRLAQRSQLQISVLFIDLDNLKEINDSLGHGTGSAFLVETAALLTATFRESDVLGRVGGDEFAVVCQCSPVAISIAAQRLEASCAARNAEAGRRFPFSFSIGYVTSSENDHQSLKELLAQADKAMYEEKRRKKLNRD